MRTQVVNRTPFWYALYSESVPAVDDDGFYTGEDTISYGEPVKYTKGNISPAKGYAQIEQFGNLESYDKVIVTCDMDCPIDENSILWIDRSPENSPHDYIVKRVAKSKNVIAYAVSQVKVDAPANPAQGAETGQEDPNA